MAIFAAIARLMEIVGNMTKKRNDPVTGSSSDAKYDQQQNGDSSKKPNITCPPKPPKSSVKPSSNSGGQNDTDPGLDMELDDLLPSMNLNMDEEDDDIDNEPGKSFLEMLFGFILDPITAIIKGIIQMVELAIITVNVVMNLNRCAKWFVVYVFCTLVYIPISMLFALLNLSTLEKKIWKMLYSIDAALFCVIEKIRGPGQGFHIAKFSDDIREVCFLETVVPTDCKPKGNKNKKKNKGFNLSNLLGSHFFLFLVILIICIVLFIFGTKNGGLTIVPFSFLILFGMVVLTMVFIIVSIFTSYFLYLFIILVLPIVFFVLSFLFGYIPIMLFPEFYSNENKIDKNTLFNTFLHYLQKFSIYSVPLFNSIMNRIDPLPNVVKYIIASVSFFVLLVVIMIIIALSIPKPDSNDESTTAAATALIQSSFS
jgi:hypothetical protein